MSKYVTSTNCPDCGCREFKRVDDSSAFTIVSIRECADCNARYLPPVPKWAAVVALLIGVAAAVSGFPVGYVLYYKFYGGSVGLAACGACALVGIAGIVFAWLAVKELRSRQCRTGE